MSFLELYKKAVTVLKDEKRLDIFLVIWLLCTSTIQQFKIQEITLLDFCFCFALSEKDRSQLPTEIRTRPSVCSVNYAEPNMFMQEGQIQSSSIPPSFMCNWSLARSRDCALPHHLVFYSFWIFMHIYVYSYAFYSINNALLYRERRRHSKQSSAVNKQWQNPRSLKLLINVFLKSS